MTAQNWIDDSRSFLEAVEEWYQALPGPKLEEVITNPAEVAVLCVDLIVGFAYEGALSSPRVAGIVPDVVRLFSRAQELGVRHFLLPQDAHEEEAVEFGAFAPHAVAGSKEAETVAELQDLAFSGLFHIIPKNTINSAMETGLNEWLDAHPQVNTFIVTGDCTDLCVYQLAMHLRLRANAKGLQQRVIVPANAVETYHIGVGTAKTLGIMPHHGDLMHYLFLHHMALNGIEIVRELV